MLNFLKNVNKWFYAFVGAVVALVAAIVVAVILGVASQNETPPATQPTEGVETGIYYYDLEMGELQLSLNSGNKFSLTGPGYNTSGEYTVDGNQLTLDFIRDEDGTATAVLNGDTLQLTLGESVMTFLKKINYTVSYNTNGGGVISDTYVVNGKLAVKPNDPVMNGHVFLGWYADMELKTPFDFMTTLIKADTMLYARWVEKVEGQPEYTVSFDLGYEGAESLPEIPTIGGKVYLVNTPTRQGYTFEGWFISMYDEGEKLTYEYTEDITLSEDTTLYAVWSVADTNKLPAPKVSISATSIKWNAVVGASAYKLKVTEPDGSVLFDETLGATTKNVGFAQLAEGDYIVEVSAVANKAENSSDTATRYYRNKALDRVSSFTVIDGTLIFNAVRNAEKYLVTVECGNASHNHTLYDNGKSTNFYFANCTMQKGGIKFTVTAVAEGYASSVSKTFVYERVLTPVANVAYDKADDAFIWDPVPFAAHYTVLITAGGETYTFSKHMSYAFDLGDYSGDISIEVIPVTEGYLSPESTKASCHKTAPATPQNLIATNTVLTWNDNGATSYEVKIGDKSFTVTEPTFDLTKAEGLSLNVGEEYSITIRAIRDGESSDFCPPITVGYYKMTSTLTYKNNTVFWTPVLGCANFEIRVNGGAAVTVTNANSAKVTLTKSGLNVIEVRCTDLDNADWVAMQVNAYAVTYMTRTAAGEITEYLAVGDTMSLPRDFKQDGFTFDGWYNVPDGAEGNGKEHTDPVFNSNNSIVLFANWKANEYKIIFNVDPDMVGNMAHGSSQTVTFNKPFTLPEPTAKSDDVGFFKGWYTDAYGKGTQITDAEGNGLAPYTYTADLNVYPFFDTATDLLSYELLPDGTYAVKGGPKVGTATKLRIPATYQGIEITEISDNAFLGCSQLKSVSLPDTIRHIGVGAFDNCPKMEAFDVYVAKEGTYEVFYASADGALLYFDKASGNNYLEIFPRAKTGTYTIPEQVDTIRPYAFNNANISKVVITKNVDQISENAFYNCGSLETIEFSSGREVDVTIHVQAFYGLNKVTMLKLPARITPFDSSMSCLNSLPALTTILVEEGSSVYTAVDNYLCDANPAGLTILYVPKTIKGEFKAPQGISGIGANVFRNNGDITSVVIPAYINSVGSYAFAGCHNLTTFTVEGPRNGDLQIGANAFASCTKLTTVDFTGANTTARGQITVGDSAFTGCTALTTFKVGAGVKVASIGNNAFKNDTKLSTIQIDDTASLTTIGNNAFEKCSALESFTVHKTTTNIGSSAFKNCSSLQTFIFGESETPVSFGNAVFAGCSVLRTIRLPKTLAAFDGSVFNDCISLQSIEVDAANPNLQSRDGVLYTKGLTEILFYPKNLDGDLSKLSWDTLTKIGSAVFKNNQRITSVKLGAHVTEIGAEAFYGCTALASVSYDSANKQALSVGAQAFYGCTKLTSASVPATTVSIGTEAFYNTAISSFTLPASLTTIGSGTFANTSLVSIEIPAGVTSIGNGAFAGASKLTSVTFKGSDAPLVIGDGTAASGEGVFNGTKLTTVTLSKNVTSIGSYAFANISTLTKVVVPADSALTEIGSYAFSGCSKLSSFDFRNGLSSIGASAFEGVKLASASFPASMTYIGNNAFKSVPLTSVSFANGPAGASLEICEGAFANTAFPTVKLPSHMTALGAYNEPYNYYTVDTVFEGNTVLHTINVDNANRLYLALDGILYLRPIAEMNDLLLVYCPRAKTGAVRIPTNVYMVGARAFYGTKLTSIIFDEYAKTDTEHYGQPLLTVGSFNSASGNASSYATIGNTTTLQLIKFPSHLDTVNSYAIHGVNLPPKPKAAADPVASLIIQFNKDSVNGVSFQTYAIFSNSAVVAMVLPPVREMSGYAFSGQYNMTTLTIPADSPMAVISAYGFSGNQLKNFTVPKNVKVIEDFAFQGCSQLSSITWAGDQVHTLGKSVFAHCAFTSFKIPDSVEFVGSGLFAYNNNLTSIELSMNMTSPVVSPTESMISNCPAIQEIRLPENHPTMQLIDGILYSKDGKTVYLCPANKQIDGILEIPNGVETIEVGAFNSFQGRLIKFPNTLKTIKYEAFRECQLEMVIFPASLEVIEARAFYFNAQNSNLTTVAFEGTSHLKAIGERAFYQASITNFSIPNGTTSIGNYAFSACSKLQSLTIPGTVTSMGVDAFRGCISLTDLNIGSGLPAIADRAFMNCTSLTSVSVPASVQKIGLSAFSNCTNLESVYFPENSQLTTVGNTVFNKCANLKTIIFGDKLSTLGTNMFQGCTSLVEVRLPNAMTSIPANLFANCADLTTVNIPTSVTTIGNAAFQNCASLTEITISAKVRSIGASAFAGCSNLERVIFAGGCTVTSIPANAFDGATKLTTINLPATVTSIGDYAFRNTAVTDIDFKNITTVGTESFYGCTNLKAAAFSGALRTIGAKAFAGCTSLETVNLAMGLTSIGELAFENCVSVQSFNIPATLTSMSGNPFSNCSGVTRFTVDSANKSFIFSNGALFDKTGFTLIYYSAANTAETYTLPDTVHEILAGAFAGSKLKTFAIPATANITVIPAYAFKDSKLLTSISIPATVQTIGDHAFEGCSALLSVNIPESVTHIGDYAFADCAALASVTLSPRNTAIKSLGSHLFENCVSLTSVIDFYGFGSLSDRMYANTGIVNAVIPAGVTDLSADGVFENCAALKTVVLPTTVTKDVLGNYFFYNCTSLESVILPAAVTRISDTDGRAFMNCTSLTAVTFNGPVHTIGVSTFENCSELTTVTCAGNAPDMLMLYERAFANCSKLTSTELLNYCHQLSAEAFLNCASFTGTFHSTAKFNDLGNYAFSGTNFSEIHFHSIEMNVGEFGFGGLTENTTIYFETMSETIARKRFAAALDNAKARFVFVPDGNSGGDNDDITAELTKDELAGIDRLVSEHGKELGNIGEALQKALLEFKSKGYLNDVTSAELSKDEIAFIDNFVRNNVTKDFYDHWFAQFQSKLIAYKTALIPSAPVVELTKNELAGIDQLVSEHGKELGNITEALQKALLEFKSKGYLNDVTSAELSKDEIAFIDNFVRNNVSKDFYDHWFTQFQNKLMDYKKTLMRG